MSDEPTYSGPTEIPQEVWEEHFSGQRMLFGISPAGQFTAYVSSNRSDDPGGYPIEDTDLRVLGVEIGGNTTKVCWTSGGEKHCDPPPPR